MFGEYVKGCRLALGVSLRKFCLALDFDPSNWSKIERGILQPPKDLETLEKIAAVLNIKAGSREWEKLIDYATVDRGEIPEFAMRDEDIIKLLPAFFRTVGSVKPTKEELLEMLEKLKEAHK
jgi:transcriptional regulator with XRE-family HTH domain